MQNLSQPEKANRVRYVKGDATAPQGTGNKIICHICNDIGAWGAGFVLALSRKWKEPEREYRKWSRKKSFALGKVQFVGVANDIIVANMVAQSGIGKNADGLPPIRYEAVRECLRKVCKEALAYDASVHGPKFGSALAGGDWKTIEAIIQEELCEKGVEVTIYEFTA